jgi:hypothetical protein
VLTVTTDPPSSRLPMSLETLSLSPSWFTELTTSSPSCLDCRSFVPTLVVCADLQQPKQCRFHRCQGCSLHRLHFRHWSLRYRSLDHCVSTHARLWGLRLTGSHECGHQSYSSSKSINNFVGWVLHSILLVPYHSWRISHGQHHAATGHMTRDQVFVPRTRSQLGHPAVKEDEEIQGIK